MTPWTAACQAFLSTTNSEFWSFSFSISPSNEYVGLISSRVDWLDLLAVQGTLKSVLQCQSSNASINISSYKNYYSLCLDFKGFILFSSHSVNESLWSQSPHNRLLHCKIVKLHNFSSSSSTKYMSMHLFISPSRTCSRWSEGLSPSSGPTVCAVRLPTSSQAQFVLCTQWNHVTWSSLLWNNSNSLPLFSLHSFCSSNSQIY